MAKNIDTVTIKKKLKNASQTYVGEDIWVKHYKLQDLFRRKESSGWSLPKNDNNDLFSRKIGNVFVRPASPELIKEAKKIKKKQEKTKGGFHKAKRVAFFTLKTLVITSLAFFVIFSAAVYSYQNNFKGRAFYGIKILGEELGGKTELEIKRILDQKIKDISFSFEIDGEKIVATPEDAGVSFESAVTAKEAVLSGKKDRWPQSQVYASKSLIYSVVPKASAFSITDFQGNLNFKYTIDEKKLADFTQSLSLKFNEDSKNAGLVMQGAEVQVIPAVYGRRIVTDSVKAQIARAVSSVKSERIIIEVDRVDPEIIESDTRKSIEEAKSLLSLPVIFTYKEKKFIPDRATVGGWIVFNTIKQGEKDYLKPSVDAKKVYSYVYSLAGQINIPAVNRKITVKNGVETIVDEEGKEGLAVDVDKASFAVANSLSQGKAVNLELPTYVVKPKTNVNNVLVADWSKYIEVNISTQTMCAYLAGGEKVNCWAITTGANGWSTPTGTFLISRKSGEGGAPGAYGGGVCMPNPPSKYPLCGINYVSTFTPQGHAIHEAWWRSSFGGQDYKWNGSHGCVNTTYDIAKWIYYWAPIGTPVIIHY